MAYTGLTIDPLASCAGTHTYFHPIIGVVVAWTVSCIDTYPLRLSVVSVQLVAGGSVSRTYINTLICIHVVIGTAGTYQLAALGCFVLFVSTWTLEHTLPRDIVPVVHLRESGTCSQTSHSGVVLILLYGRGRAVCLAAAVVLRIPEIPSSHANIVAHSLVRVRAIPVELSWTLVNAHPCGVPLVP